VARRRKRRPARAIRKKRQDLLGYLIGVGCFLLLAALAAGIYQITRTHITVDEHYCPETGPVNVTAVLVDRTDRLSSVQQASVRKHLEDLRTSIPTHGLLEVYSVGPTDERLLTAEFRLCNPGRGKEVSEWIDNPARAERRWKEFFAGPLQDVFDRMVNSGEAARSPIMESIQSVALSAFAGQALQDTPKRLIIVFGHVAAHGRAFALSRPD